MMLVPAKPVKPKDYSGWYLEGEGGSHKREIAIREKFMKLVDEALDMSCRTKVADAQKLLAELANKGCETWVETPPNDILVKIAPSLAPCEFDPIWSLSLRDALTDFLGPNDPEDARDRKRVVAILRALADEIEAGK